MTLQQSAAVASDAIASICQQSAAVSSNATSSGQQSAAVASDAIASISEHCVKVTSDATDRSAAVTTQTIIVTIIHLQSVPRAVHPRGPVEGVYDHYYD